MTREAPGPYYWTDFLAAATAQPVPDDAAAISAANTRPRCNHHPYSWHYLDGDAPTCEEFNAGLVGGAGFSALHEHPNALVKHAGSVFRYELETMRKSLSLTAATYQRTLASDRRTITILAVMSAAGWGLSMARGIWGF